MEKQDQECYMREEKLKVTLAQGGVGTLPTAVQSHRIKQDWQQPQVQPSDHQTNVR